MPIRIIFADDHELLREGFRSMFTNQNQIEIIGEATNGDELITLVGLLKPDVVLTDIKMPRLNGIEATKILKKKYPDLPIIALTMFNEDFITLEMMEAGASGYLLKNADKSEIIAAINSVMINKPYYDKETANKLADLLVKSRVNAGQDIPEVLQFSSKELEIIRLVCAELTNKEIAEKLNLSIRTVEGYKDRILEKIGAKNTAGVVVYAIKNKIYSFDEN